MDVIDGRGPAPALVSLLVERLPDNSYTHALAAGGREHFGWGLDRHIQADLFDALNANTRATGNWGKNRAPKLPVWPRPKVKVADAKGPKTVRDIYAMLTRR